MSVETQPNQPIKPQFDVGRLRSFLQKKFHLPERQKLRVLSRLAAVGIVAIASLAVVNLALANPDENNPNYYTSENNNIAYLAEAYLGLSSNNTLTQTTKHLLDVQRDVQMRSSDGEENYTGGGVLDAWIERYGCGAGENGEVPADVMSWLKYWGTVLATQTHLLETTSWTRGVEHVDDLNAPDWVTIIWGSGTALNPNDPIPGLPLRWIVSQKATAKETGENLLNKQYMLDCPSVQMNKAILGVPTWFTVTEANASSFGLKVGNRRIRASGGVFSYTFPNTGDFPVTVSAEGLGKTVVSRVITVNVTTNTAPVANAGEDQVVTPGTEVQLDGSGSSDPDGHGLIWGWQQTGGIPVFLNSPEISRPTFIAPQAGHLTFTHVVTDELGLPSLPDEVVVKVDNLLYLPLVIANYP